MKSSADLLAKLRELPFLGLMNMGGGSGGMGLMDMMGGGSGGFQPMGLMQMLGGQQQKPPPRPGVQLGLDEQPAPEDAVPANQQVAMSPGMAALLRSRGIRVGGLLDG